MVKKILLGLLVVFIVIQFVRPVRNEGEAITETSISKHYAVPTEVQSILDRSCNDCHSNHTNYPWYVNIQPGGWWMQHHVDEGKRELNFSEFGNYTARKKAHKLEELAEQVEKDKMPLDSYLWIHTDAKLSDADKKILIDWANQVKASVEAENAAATPAE